MRKIIVLSISLLTVIISGCAAPKVVTIDVIPADAKVIVNGAAYNNGSPIFIEASSGEQLAITAYKDGYREQIHVVDYSLSRLGEIQAWTSFLIIPSIGLCFDSAWQLNENNIRLSLEPLTPEAKKEIATEIHHGDADQTKDKKAKETFSNL